MWLYAIYNETERKFASKGEIDSVKNGGYFAKQKSFKELKDRFFCDTPDYYTTLGAATRQLKYCCKIFKDDVLYLIKYELEEKRRFVITDNDEIKEISLGKFLYEKD